jgi:hypothetical protein
LLELRKQIRSLQHRSLHTQWGVEEDGDSDGGLGSGQAGPAAFFVVAAGRAFETLLSRL